MTSLCCSAIDCGPPHGIDDVILSVTSTKYNGSATFQCNRGYWFYRGVYSITSTCLADGVWTALAVDACKCKCSFSFSVSGPTVWNALPDYPRNPTLPIDVFKSYLKKLSYLLIINTTL